MDDKAFDRFLKLTRGRTLAEIRMNEVRDALADLLTTEFKDLSSRKFKVLWTDPGERACAKIGQSGGNVYLWINPENWETPGFEEKPLKELLRHELLHILTGKKDADPEFRREARKRGIQIWSIDAGDLVPM